MNQSLWRKGGYNQYMWPAEEKYFKGARLGEYARPLITNRNLLGYLNRAPVPLSASEDELGLLAQASSSTRRARQAATYAKSAADKAIAFYRAAKLKARAVFQDPPISVLPTADVFPLYSASLPSVDP